MSFESSFASACDLQWYLTSPPMTYKLEGHLPVLREALDLHLGILPHRASCPQTTGTPGCSGELARAVPTRPAAVRCYAVAPADADDSMELSGLQSNSKMLFIICLALGALFICAIPIWPIAVQL